jgi:hypothetical protein
MEGSRIRTTTRAGAWAAAMIVASLVVLAGTAVTRAAAPAEARQIHGPVSHAGTEAQTSASIASYIRSLARRWKSWPPRRIVTRYGMKKIKQEWREWRNSQGTDCDPPFPSSFCSTRLERWGLGQALWSGGRAPGVWNRPNYQRREIGPPLTPRFVYWLSCWTYGDRVYGPYKNTTIWYWAAYRGYVSGALLYTGSWNQIPGVRRC